jgi:hypothetical protein
VTDDFGYLNARIRVRRSQLLPDGFFSEGLRLSFPELVKVLGETIYGPDLTGDSLPDVDRAVLVHLSRTVGDLPRLVAGEALEAVNLIWAPARFPAPFTASWSRPPTPVPWPNCSLCITPWPGACAGRRRPRGNHLK